MVSNERLSNALGLVRTELKSTLAKVAEQEAQQKEFDFRFQQQVAKHTRNSVLRP